MNKLSKLDTFITNNNWTKIAELINKYKDDVLKRKFINNRNILHLACINNKYDILILFVKSVKYFIKGDIDGNTPLHLLLIGGYFNTFKKLAPKIKDNNIYTLTNNKNETILYLINKYNNNIFKYLLNKVDGIDIGFNAGNIPLLIYNIKQSTKYHDDYYKNIELLIKKGADINYPINLPPLCYSLYEQKTYLLDLLIKNGANVNIVDQNELTPLLIASENKDYETVKQLILHGANVNYINVLNDENIMKSAILDKQNNTVDMLINNGFNLNNLDKDLNTVLHLAIINDLSYEIIFKLLYYCNINKQNLNGETPLHLLVQKYNIDVFDVILENKKLDIFINDQQNRTPLYYINKSLADKFIDIAVNSYIKQLNDSGIKSEQLSSCVKDMEKDCVNIIKTHMLSTKRSFPDDGDKNVLYKKFTLIKGNYINNSKFNPNALHNLLYTIEFLNKYNNLGIPTQYGNIDKYYTDLNKLKLSTFGISNKSNLLISTLITYMNFLYEVVPYLIIWKSLEEHYITPNLMMYLKNLLDCNKIQYIIFKLTVLHESSSHANIIIYDKNKKILERFEPYGFISTVDNKSLDGFIWTKIGKKIERYINDKIEYINPLKYTQIASFQLISNDNLTSYKKTGDPVGYCLAWTFWYLEMRLNNPDIHPLTLIEKSINDILKTNINANYKTSQIEENNKIFIDFIRNYSDNLDKIKNNVMINKIGINKNNIYNMIYSGNDISKIYGYFKNQINVLRV